MRSLWEIRWDSREKGDQKAREIISDVFFREVSSLESAVLWTWSSIIPCLVLTFLFFLWRLIFFSTPPTNYPLNVSSLLLRRRHDDDHQCLLVLTTPSHRHEIHMTTFDDEHHVVMMMILFLTDDWMPMRMSPLKCDHRNQIHPISLGQYYILLL